MSEAQGVSDMIPLLITGGNGRIGRVLRATGMAIDGLHPIWQARRAAPGFLAWDILNEACPEGVAGGVVLALAGGTKHTGPDMALNAPLAMAACHAARKQGARHVFLASSAAVYGVSDTDFNEESPCAAVSAYGAAKLRMEREAIVWHRGQAAPGLTLLRIGNIAGLDALLGGVLPGVPVVLDPVAGTDDGPVRSYIGPVTLAAVFAGLVRMAATGAALPLALNIAAPAPVGMAALLDAAELPWHFGAPNPKALARVALKTDRLHRLVPLPPEAGAPAEMVAEWHGIRDAVA